MLRGAKSNELRMAALGFPVFRYRLVACIIAGAFGGLAGILLANEGAYHLAGHDVVGEVGRPDRDGRAGRHRRALRPVYGARRLLRAGGIAEALLDLVHKGWGEYWQIVFGPLLVLIALYARAASPRCWAARHD